MEMKRHVSQQQRNRLVKKWLISFLGCTLLLSAGPATAAIAATNDQAWTLRILHTNDTHGHLESVARLTTIVNEQRQEKPNSLLLSAGDVFDGTAYFKQYRGQADLKFMNMLGYDAMTIGNHELAPEDLANFVKNANFPILNANYDFSKEPSLAPLIRDAIKDGKDAGGQIYPAITLKLDGDQVGIIGLTTGEDIEMEDEMKLYDLYSTTKKMIGSLNKQGVNKIIVLSHLGYFADLDLAKNVEGIDVIVGGHTHTQLDRPVVVNRERDKAPTVVVQTGQYGEYLGSLDVTFDKSGKLTAWNGKLVPVNEQDEAEENYLVAEDAKAKKLLDELTAPLELLKNQVVGTSKVNLNGERFDVRSKETNLGNLIVDSMLDKAQEKTDATMALISGGNIRASIDEGDITMSEVSTTMPFEHNLVTLRLTGQQIMQALENGVSEVEKKTGKFPHVAGMKFVWDPDAPPFKRIVSVEAKTATGYEPIRLDSVYTLATVKYLADGGDGYEVFNQAQNAGKMRNLGGVDTDIFINYLNKLGPVSPGTEGRIKEGKQNGTEQGTGNGAQAFTDIENHWARQEIERLAELGVVSGSGHGKFVPDAKLKRSELASLLVKALSLKDSSQATELDFADIPDKAWYKNAAVLTVNEQLLNVTDESKFEPNAAVSREQMAVTMIKAYEYITGNRAGELNEWQDRKFADIAAVSEANRADVQRAVSLGLLSSGDDGMFHPGDYLTRAQACVVIARLLELR